MKKIEIYAYTRLNLGDDLFIKTLCERYPNQKFIINCPKKYYIPFKKLSNLKNYSLDSFWKRLINYIMRKCGYENYLYEYYRKKCDISITIGGSLFMQNSNWKNGISSFKLRAANYKKSYILGSNFGPYSDNEYLIQYREVFKEFTDICLRDKYSYNLFKDLKNIRMAPDIVFHINKKNEFKENTILISVIKPSERKELIDIDEKYYNKIKDICIYGINKGYKINLMSFCRDEGDEEAIESIIKIIPKYYIKNINKYYYNGNIEEALEVISKSRAVVATRFHAMILGYAFNKSVFPIIYSNKMKNVINDIDNNISYLELKSLDTIDVETIIKYLEKKNINIDEAKEKSLMHFEKLDKDLLKYKL